MQKIACDIVYIKSIKIKKTNIDRYLSFFEKQKLENINSKLKKRQYVAGLIAAKEAIIKIFNELFEFSLINLIDKNYNHLSRIQLNNHFISISISHVKDYAIAVAILED